MSLNHPGYALPREEARKVSLFHRCMRGPVGVVALLAMVVVISGPPMVLLQPVMLPLLHFGVISQRFMRRFLDYIAGAWIYILVFYLENVLGIRVHSFGHSGKFKQRCIFLMNHRSHFDWMFFWGIVDRHGDLTVWKAVMKSILKSIPIMGQAMQYQNQIFISRKWEKDQKELEQKLFYLNAVDVPLQLLLFPEGGDLNERSKKRSDEYADKNGLPRYEYCLHPHTRGLNYIADVMRSGGLDAIYDVTLGYPDSIAFEEKDFFRGTLPRDIHFFIKEYKIEDLPRDEEGLSAWCQERWREKEERLREFYKHKRFTEEIRGCVRNASAQNGGYGNRVGDGSQNETTRLRVQEVSDSNGTPSLHQHHSSPRGVFLPKNLVNLVCGVVMYSGMACVLYYCVYVSVLWKVYAVLSTLFLIYVSYWHNGIDYLVMSYSKSQIDKAIAEHSRLSQS